MCTQTGSHFESVAILLLRVSVVIVALEGFSNNCVKVNNAISVMSTKKQIKSVGEGFYKLQEPSECNEFTRVFIYFILRQHCVARQKLSIFYVNGSCVVLGSSLHSD